MRARSGAIPRRVAGCSRASSRSRARCPCDESRMTRRRWLPLLALISSLPVAAPARAALADWNGHLGLGYGKLFVADAPSGGFSIGAGMDYPLGKIRVG